MRVLKLWKFFEDPGYFIGELPVESTSESSYIPIAVPLHHLPKGRFRCALLNELFTSFIPEMQAFVFRLSCSLP
jgi:hypothetical protein